MPNMTTNYGWYLPLVADAVDEDLWGGYLNDNIIDQDTVTKSISDIADAAAPEADPTFTGTVTINGNLNQSVSADIPSASTIDLQATAMTGDVVTVTGNVSINTINLENGATRTVRFTGNPTIVNGANLVIPGGSLTVAPNDIVQVVAIGGVRYVLANPPSAIKAWGNVTYSGGVVTVNSSFNVASVIRNAPGDFTITFTNALQDANYVIPGSVQRSTTDGASAAGYLTIHNSASPLTTTTARIGTTNGTGVWTDPYKFTFQVVR